MPYRLEIGKHSTHPESIRIGRLLEMQATQRMLNCAVIYARDAVADGYEAAFVRDAHTRGGNVAIGLLKAGNLVGFVANEDNPFFCPTLDGWVYNQGPQVTIVDEQ